VSEAEALKGGEDPTPPEGASMERRSEDVLWRELGRPGVSRVYGCLVPSQPKGKILETQGIKNWKGSI